MRRLVPRTRAGLGRALTASALGTALAVGLLALGQAPATAADGAIDYVEPTSEGLQVLVSVPPETKVDLDGVTVTVGGASAPAEAVAAATQTLVRRTAVLVIDTSRSMRGDRFRAAKQAARTYLASVPDDVYVGIVSFADEVVPLLQPTQDRAEARALVGDLSLSRRTRLYDGVLAGVEMAGSEGQRSLLVLSDGADTSRTAVAEAVAAVSSGGVLLDVVALEQEGPDVAALRSLATAGAGAVISADSAALAEAFSAEADVLATQVLVTAQVPGSVDSEMAQLTVTLPSSDGDITTSAFTTVRGPVLPTMAAPDRSWAPPAWVMYGGIGAIALGLVALLALAVPASDRTPTAYDRVTAYTAASGPAGAGKPEAEAPLNQARDAVQGVLNRNRSLDERITLRLEGAGSQLKSSEWVLVQAAIFLGAGAFGLLLGQGDLIVGIIFLALGLVLPWVYLGFRRSRRRKAFNAALPDTLSLISGSLAAGMSLGQSVDTIVREGAEPVAGEFRRVLVETRLGVPLEVALDGVAERFESKDFEWVVMAIRIQRQVGGNLAELLDTVGATMREREYLRRQVNALAAEGKLSAIVLSVLPPGFLLYLLVAQRDYVMPLFTDPRGLLMLIGATFWLLVGVFWMSKLVKVEV